MGCGRCGATLEEGDRFCGHCGAPVGGCPSCGAPVIAGHRFCRACGAALAEVTPAPSAAGPAAPTTVPGPGREPTAERRVCSVLFCDVVGFTPLSEARDPEAVRELLSEYFEVARTVIGRYGGVVEKFIGDAVMAVWGTPAATEGDAERAVRAALDLVTAVAELGAEAGLPGLAARAGVVTGEVAVNLGAVGEGMVAGDAVNTAPRVQAAAEPGSVLVDEATQRLAGSAIGFADAGEHALKGKAGPVQLWRATRVLAAVGGSQRVDGLEAPLTGRDAELRTIKDLFHAAADRRVPRLVLVSGPAGVGKSRLGWEFEKYIDGLKAQVWWHRGRCLSYGEGVTFWALAQIVRQRLGIAEEDPPEVAAGKLAQGLDRYVPDPGERAYAGPRVARLLGVAFAGDSGGPLSREELFAGWRLFFERLAAVQPVVLVVEDAQHADTGLLDFLDYLIDWVRDLPVYVLVLARPELGQARPGFGTGRNRTALTLDPLDAASMDQLVDALVPGMPTAARAKITAQAQGIPLFAVETIRSLVDRDIVQPVEGVYRLTGDVGELAVPDSLHALLAARLDALEAGARRLVADAAVLGATFPAEALIAVSGQDEAVVRAALAELVRREVLAVSADRLSPERGSLRVRPGDAAPGRLRHLVPPGPQDPAPGRGRAPACRVRRRRRRSGRGDRPALPGRAGRGARRRRRADPRPGHRRADPGGRPGRPHWRPDPGRRQLRCRGPAHPGQHHRRAANRRRRVVGTRRRGRPHRCRLGRGGRAGRPGRGAVPAVRRDPLGRPHPDDRREGAAPVGSARPGEGAADRRRGGAARRPRHRHRPRPGRTGGAGGARRVTRGGCAVRRGPGPGPGPGRRRRHPGRPVHHPRDQPHLRRTQAPGGRQSPGGRPASRAGRRHRPAGPRPAQPVRRGDRHQSRRRRGSRPRRRRPAAPGWRPHPPRYRGREPGPGAADDR